MSLDNTLRRLLTLANSPSTPEGERAAAKKAIERIRANSPGLDLDAIQEPEPAYIDVPYKEWRDEYLLIYAASFLGLSVYNLRCTRKLKQPRIEGDPRLLVTFQELVGEYRPKLEELLKHYMHGFLHKTFPQPPSDREDDPDRKPLSDELLQATMAGMDAGRPANSGRLAAGTIEGVNPDGTSETIANLDYESDTWFSDIHDRRLDWADVQIRDTHFPPEAP